MLFANIPALDHRSDQTHNSVTSRRGEMVSGYRDGAARMHTAAAPSYPPMVNFTVCSTTLTHRASHGVSRLVGAGQREISIAGSSDAFVGAARHLSRRAAARPSGVGADCCTPQACAFCPARRPSCERRQILRRCGQLFCREPGRRPDRGREWFLRVHDAGTADDAVRHATLHSLTGEVLRIELLVEVDRRNLRRDHLAQAGRSSGSPAAADCSSRSPSWSGGGWRRWRRRRRRLQERQVRVGQDLP